MRERTPTPFRDSTPNPPLLKCSLLARAPKYAVCLGQGIKFFFNPVTMTFFLESIFIVLYFGDFKNSDVIHVHLCKLHNMMLPPMVTIVGLYGIFRQKRPTLKYDHGTYKRIGTIYGMPSGDAFFAGAICSLLIDKTPLFSIFIVVAVCYSRTIVGYHNIMQVLVGAILGIILEISMKFIPTDTFVIWNWITTIFLPLIIFFDKNFEIVEKCDYDNLQIWVIIDFAYIAFDVIYCAPESLKIFPNISQGLRLALAVSMSVGFHLLSTVFCMRGISVVTIVKSVFK